MFWMAMALLLLVAGVSLVGRRRRYEAVEEEPWRASLGDDDEPLDVEEARRAEEEFLESDFEEDDEPWG